MRNASPRANKKRMDFLCLDSPRENIPSYRKVWRAAMSISAILFILFILFIHTSLMAQQDTIDYLIPLIIQAESSGNPNASDGHSYGLMGISYSVLEDYKNHWRRKRPKNILWGEISDEEFNSYQLNVGDLFNPNLNVKIGTWYLHWIQGQLPDEYKQSKKHIIFSYNSGIGKLKKLNYKIPSWTKNHPNRIYRRIYRGEI